MQDINFHLAYLLTKHECVIIPGLGSFVVSHITNADKNGNDGVFCPPTRVIGFNPEIKHSDGLLADSIAKERNTPYAEVLLLVRQYVDNLLERLYNNEVIQIPWIGDLHLSQNHKIIFNPTTTLSCNAPNYGLTSISLPNVENQTEKEYVRPETNKDIIWIPLRRKTIIYAASVAAALLAMFFIPTPLNNYSGKISTRYASVIHLPAKPPVAETFCPEFDTKIQSETVNSTEKISAQKISPIANKAHSRQYFIIVASLPDQKSAEATLKTMQSEGFEEATIIVSESRFRIGVSQFENKQEAEIFLKQFRKDNPDHASAWLLGQKVEF